MFDEMLKSLSFSDEDIVDGSSFEVTEFADSDALPSAYPVSTLALSSVQSAAHCLQRFALARGLSPGTLSVDPVLSSLWFSSSARAVGWQIPPLWDPIAGDYACADGWIRLHTNYEHHRQAALSVLGCKEERSAVEQTVALRSVDEFENAVVKAGGCAAAMRSMTEWAEHKQGQSVAREPLIHWSVRDSDTAERSESAELPKDLTKPLHGIKVLDCTRVLAGPAATRFLAGFGADVLRIDPPHWEEGGINTDMTLGKRRAGLDLKLEKDRATFRHLLQQADVFVHGLRADAMESLGLGDDTRQRINPQLIDVALNAYGWSGPWAMRRGFDSLVQMSCGIADHGMRIAAIDKPRPLPVQALDHATGYLMAASVLTGLYRLKTEGVLCSARLSLARTATLLTNRALYEFTGDLTLDAFDHNKDNKRHIENTVWGQLGRLPFPVSFEQCAVSWQHPAGELRVHLPEW